MYVIYFEIDIPKYKHDYFVCKNTGEVIVENLSLLINTKRISTIFIIIETYDNSNVQISLENIGHYSLNLRLFLENNNYIFMKFNYLLVKKLYKSLFLRKTKTDKVDAIVITKKLISVPYKPNSRPFYHKYSIKSLTRLRKNFSQTKRKI